MSRQATPWAMFVPLTLMVTTLAIVWCFAHIGSNEWTEVD